MLKALTPCLLALAALAGAPAQAAPTQCFAAGFLTSGPDRRLDEPKYVFLTSVFDTPASLDTLTAWFEQDVETALGRRPDAWDLPILRQFGCWLVMRESRAAALLSLHWRDGRRATYTYEVGWEPVGRQIGPLRRPTFRPPPNDLPSIPPTPPSRNAPAPKIEIPEVMRADAPAGQHPRAALGLDP